MNMVSQISGSPIRERERRGDKLRTWAGTTVSRLEQRGTLRTIDDYAHNAEAALENVNVRVCVCHLVSR
jgi:hypothetical protein